MTKKEVFEKWPFLKDLTEVAQRHYGDRLHGIILFGSRVRGDYNPDSDFDIALVMSERVRSKHDYRSEFYDQFLNFDLDNGIHSQVLPVAKNDLSKPKSAIHSAIMKEGILLTEENK